MKSERIEYLRFDDLSTGILMGGKPYLLAHGDFNSLQEVKTPIGQLDLLEKLGQSLRYRLTEGTKNDKWAAIQEFSDQIQPFFIDFKAISQETQHLELLLNPSELALIPFELLLDEKGVPRFVKKSGKQLVPTRNFRRVASRHNGKIPIEPRILFAHSKPIHKNYLGLPFPDIPSKSHERYLKQAIRHLDHGQSFKVMPDPTFEEFKKEVLDAAQAGHPYTHIHILAHGSLIFDHRSPSNFEYGIAFYSKEPKESAYKATPAQEIRVLFNSLRDDDLPYLVNYMICDGANFTNGYKPDRNPVQATFAAGIPVVLGSQFPLSMKGSEYISRVLYKRLFQGDDIRLILGDIRTSLYQKKEVYGHDWISLVTYINFPSNYSFQLLDQKLRRQLMLLNHIRDRDKPVLKKTDDFISVKVRIEDSIEALTQQAIGMEAEGTKEAAVLELSGLLGSAYKRLAEIELMEQETLGTNTSESQLNYLEEAKNWYKKAADRNQSHHWSIVQYLSLKTVLNGNLSDKELDYWYAGRRAAITDIEKDPKTYWAYGTLMELYILAPHIEYQEAREKAITYSGYLIKNARLAGREDAIVSTHFQISRYVSWWKGLPFKTPKSVLARDEGFIPEILDLLTA